MINYARMTPVYLSQMMDLKENDEKTWIIMMRGGFCVGIESSLHIQRRRPWN